MRPFRLTFALTAAALLFALAAQPLHAQDSDDGLLRRGPHGPRPQLGAQPASQPSTLPPTQPTALPVTPAAAPAQQTAPTDLHQPAVTRARVIYANGQLEVRADNSSLLQILHDISRETRMAITGGVADQRIFGDYGPAAPSTILATLLDGTGANMLLQQDPVTGAPIELILTQRAGSAPPVSPIGPGYDDSPFGPDVPASHSSAAPPASAVVEAKPAPPDPNAPHPTSYVPGSPFNQSAPPPPPYSQAVENTSAPASSSKPAANSTSTPESIYQQLLQMQQAKAKAAQSTTPAPAAAATPTTAPKQ